MFGSEIENLYNAPTRLIEGVSVARVLWTTCVGVWHQHVHMWLHWILSFSKIIIGIIMSVSMSMSVLQTDNLDWRCAESR